MRERVFLAIRAAGWWAVVLGVAACTSAAQLSPAPPVPTSVAAVPSPTDPALTTAGTWSVVTTHPQRKYFADLAWAPPDVLWVSDPTTHTIWKLSPNGDLLAKYGEKGSGPGQFSGPRGVALDGQGNVYVADSLNSRVQKLSPQGKPLGQFGRRGTGPGELRWPEDVAVDASGNVYVADSGNARVQKFSGDGTLLWQSGSSGTGLGEFSSPVAIAVDSQGNSYVADTGVLRRVQKLSPQGEPLAEWEPGGLYEGGPVGSQSTIAQSQFGVAVDSQHNVYVVSSLTNRVWKLSPDGEALATWITGTDPSAPGFPYRVSVDGKGDLYVCDIVHSGILKLTLGTR